MPSVRIDCFREALPPLEPGAVLVAVDVLRATTTAVTAAARGRRIFPAGSIEAAVRLAADLDRPLLAGELGGVMPYGFDMQNSPAQIAALEDSERPIILLSTSGTPLIAQATARGSAYVGCLRNAAAQGRWLAAQDCEVVILGAGTRGEFREEDQLCAARIADTMLQDGYRAADAATEALISRWAGAPDEALMRSRSVRYLLDTGQEEDLAFVLGHIDDLGEVFAVDDSGALSPRG